MVCIKSARTMMHENSDKGLYINEVSIVVFDHCSGHLI